MYPKISNCPVHHFPPKIDKTIVLKLSIVWFLIMYNTYTLIIFDFFPNLPAYNNLILSRSQLLKKHLLVKKAEFCIPYEVYLL